MMFPCYFSGPKACKKATKKTSAHVIEKQTVVVMIIANFCSKIIFEPNRNAPLPSVVIPPLTMLTPMAAIESVDLS